MFPRILLLAVLLAGCAGQAPEPPPVPPLMVETIPKPPVSGEQLTWQPGHWNWVNNGYVWLPGQYVPAAGHGPKWMPGWWSRGDSGWTWNPPHWTF